MCQVGVMFGLDCRVVGAAVCRVTMTQDSRRGGTGRFEVFFPYQAVRRAALAPGSRVTERSDLSVLAVGRAGEQMCRGGVGA